MRSNRAGSRQRHTRVIRTLEQGLGESDLRVKVVYSSSRDLDILPANATKGGALQWLCTYLKIPLNQVLVAGDTGNDNSLFQLPGVRGIIVENAQPELLGRQSIFPPIPRVTSWPTASSMACGITASSRVHRARARTKSPARTWSQASACFLPARNSPARSPRRRRNSSPLPTKRPWSR